MWIIWSVVFGILTFVVLLFTEKKYLPQLYERVQISHSISDEKKKSSKGKKSIVIILCIAFSMVCGYCAAMYATSWISLIKIAITMMILYCCSYIDVKLMIIPNMCSVVLILGRCLIALLELIFFKEMFIKGLFESVISMILCCVFLLIMSKITHGGIGMGDVKLISSIGFMCGLSAVCFSILFGIAICAVVATCLILVRKKSSKDYIPLGPFIWIGFGIAVLLAKV